MVSSPIRNTLVVVRKMFSFFSKCLLRRVSNLVLKVFNSIFKISILVWSCTVWRENGRQSPVTYSLLTAFFTDLLTALYWLLLTAGFFFASKVGFLRQPNYRPTLPEDHSLVSRFQTTASESPWTLLLHYPDDSKGFFVPRTLPNFTLMHSTGAT